MHLKVTSRPDSAFAPLAKGDSGPRRSGRGAGSIRVRGRGLSDRR
ncbi:hypothetical protein CSE45_1496 [Citreicella sp. SE45]|nr:hypothetical protein CSE45_1496 [Citreicella sp. SE45]